MATDSIDVEEHERSQLNGTEDDMEEECDRSRPEGDSPDENPIEAEFRRILGPDCEKKDIYVVLVGSTGSGKSTLINKLCKLEEGSEQAAKVGHGAEPYQHTEYVKEYTVEIGSMTMHIYDSRGMGDRKLSTSTIFGKMKKELKDGIDLLIICHELYGKVNDVSNEMAKKLKQYCGNKVLRHAIIVLTKADAYITQCWSYLNKKGDDMIRDETLAHIESVKRVLHDMLITNKLISKGDEIPVCVSSCIMKELPTTEDWEADLWEKMAMRCTEKAAPFLGLLAIHWQKAVIAVGGSGLSTTLGTATGASIGAMAGTFIPLPGVGMAIGAVIGGTTGGVLTLVISSTAAAVAVQRN